MARVVKSIDVDVPLSMAYNQWTQFEQFPNFMEGVHEVRQLDDSHLLWRAKVGNSDQEWEAEIREQVPDEKIIWCSTTGSDNAGMVMFDPLGDDRTRVHLEMSYDPEGFREHVGDKLGFMSRRVEGDLQRFKDFIESRGGETGGWRGEIHNPDVAGGHTDGSLDAGTPRDDPGSGQRANIEGSGGGTSAYGGPETGGIGGEYPERGSGARH